MLGVNPDLTLKRIVLDFKNQSILLFTLNDRINPPE